MILPCVHILLSHLRNKVGDFRSCAGAAVRAIEESHEELAQSVPRCAKHGSTMTHNMQLMQHIHNTYTTRDIA